MAHLLVACSCFNCYSHRSARLHCGRICLHAENIRYAAVAGVRPVEGSSSVKQQAAVFAIAAAVIGRAGGNGKIKQWVGYATIHL